MRRQLYITSLLGLAMPLLALADKTPVIPGLTIPDPPSVCDAIAGNLLQNCGFETGDFTGWTTGGNFSATGVENNYDGYAANGGNYFAVLGPVGSDGSLSQTFSTNPGDTYNISWYLKSNGTTPNDFNTTWNGTTIFSQTNIPNSNGYVLSSFSEVAAGPTSTLTFGFEDNPAYLALDDSSVTAATAAAPEPSSYFLLLFLAGTAMFLTARRRRAVLNARR